MNWFNNLKLRSKLMLSNLVLGGLVFTVAVVAVQRLANIEHDVDDVGKIMHAVDALLQADRDLYEALVAERSMIFSKPGSKDFIEQVAAHTENIKQAREQVNVFRKLVSGAEIDALFKEYERYRDSWERLTKQIRAEREADTREGRRTAIELSFGSAAQAFKSMSEQVDTMVRYVEDIADRSVVSAHDSVSSAQKIILTLLVFSLFVGALITWLIPKLIVGTMQAMQKRISELAGGGGDLTRKIRVNSRDEVGQLGDAVNSFIDSLRHLLGDIIALGEQFSEQARLLSGSAQRNAELATGATEETDMLATSITEMSASVHEVAENANGAATQAQLANDESRKGQTVVSATSTAITELSTEVQTASVAIDKLKQDTASIDDVVNVIRGIAEQTNLLALNAAIEAARAGEQGRGFAVVADEVRALASRTQSSTEEIQEMIGALQTSAGEAFSIMQGGKHAAETAVEQARQAGGSLQEINNVIAMMADMNIQIAAAAEQQSAVSGEISENANKLSIFSKDASVVSDEVEGAATKMAEMAHKLNSHLANFKI